MPQLVWVDYPVSYGFKNKDLYIGNGVSQNSQNRLILEVKTLMM
jgi:hypothetical protein